MLSPRQISGLIRRIQDIEENSPFAEEREFMHLILALVDQLNDDIDNLKSARL